MDDVYSRAKRNELRQLLVNAESVGYSIRGAWERLGGLSHQARNVSGDVFARR
jgi:hypothetical protein